MFYIDRSEVRELRKKEDKSELEWTLLNYYYMLSLISEVCVEESKFHIPSYEAIEKIREHLRNNWH
ncbi:hypothetical protein GCM10023310_69540 [Paenibacillus vulneris]|uniref:Uncharacterized protein n=1 Tax=Paenibacillus vulneris TaxID=1133364 RepID=A0ABW3UF87_9BACL